jgi:hypothetical protein
VPLYRRVALTFRITITVLDMGLFSNYITITKI